MAETVVNLVIEQLKQLVVDEVNLVSGVKAQFNQIKLDLESIRAFLKDADSKQHTDEGVKTWVNQVRDVAYDVENVMDEFLFHLAHPKRHGFAGLLRCFCGLASRHRVGSEIQSIRERMKAISDRRRDFSFASSVVDGGPNPNQHDPRLTTALFVEESEIVGIDKPKEELLGMLLREDQNPLLVSVVGMGGLGKTTLVRKVYKNEKLKKRFDCFAWVIVSQSFSIEDLLKTMMKDFIKTKEESFREDIKSLNYVQLVHTMRNYLKEKRYVVVLDDVWTVDAFENLKCALPENELKSRIIVTTRMHNVASYCSRLPDLVYKMEPLPPEEAWTLFRKKAFNGHCPDELEQPSRNILRMCGGLPLAIVAIGGLLLTRNKKTPAEWETVHRSLVMELDNNDLLTTMKKILWLSYEDLPHYLKPCFLYFGVFPEDHIVRRGQLLREWMAEGFVQPMYNLTLEDIYEIFLNELVRRSLVEVVEFDSYARVNKCKIHDLMHELILSKSREQNFVTLAKNDEGLHDIARRLTICSGTTSTENLSFSLLRSFFLFKSKEVPSFSRFRMLKVLYLNGAPLETFPDEIVNLFNLRYLNLRNTSIKEIPNSIGNLRNLQTLDLKHTYVSELPRGILKLRNIRLILMYHFRYEDSVRRIHGGKMPARIGDLTSLQKLRTLHMDGGEEQAKELGKLTQLRMLGVSGVQTQYWDTLRSSITHMRHLETLWISTNDGEEPLGVNFLSLLSPSLKGISLRGSLHMLPDMITSFVNLVKIELIASKLAGDPLKAFQHLPNLTYLALKNAYEGEKLSCGQRGFQRLRRLVMRALRALSSVYIEKGAMPNLEKLRIIDCPMLQQVPYGIESLGRLQELNFGNMPEEFVRKIKSKEGDDWDRVKHVSLIRYLFMMNGKWQSSSFVNLSEN